MHGNPTWAPLASPYDENDNGKLDPRERRSLPDTAFAYPSSRELPLVDEEHVREAVVALADVRAAVDDERELAAANIIAAAAHYGIAVPSDSPDPTHTH